MCSIPLLKVEKNLETARCMIVAFRNDCFGKEQVFPIQRLKKLFLQHSSVEVLDVYIPKKQQTGYLSFKSENDSMAFVAKSSREKLMFNGRVLTVKPWWNSLHQKRGLYGHAVSVHRMVPIQCRRGSVRHHHQIAAELQIVSKSRKCRRFGSE